MGLPVLTKMFHAYTPARSLHSESTVMVEIDRCRTQFGTKNIALRGSNYWNMLPIEIKRSESLDIRKSKLKVYTGFGW